MTLDKYIIVYWERRESIITLKVPDLYVALQYNHVYTPLRVNIDIKPIAFISETEISRSIDDRIVASPPLRRKYLWRTCSRSE